jgi:hypothetical protein
MDHIFLQNHSSFQLTSIGGTMHPLISDVTDHNVVWAGLQWPETPPPLRKYTHSTRITNYPDLPTDKARIKQFQETLDSLVENERMIHANIDQLAPFQAGCIQARLVQLSVEQARLLSPKRITRNLGRGSSFKNGYSPQFLALKASLHAHVDIRRLLWKHTRERTDKNNELEYILGIWRTKRSRYEVLATPHPQSYLFPRGRTIKDFLHQDINKKIKDLRSHMHGRLRQRLRVAMSDRMRDLETLLASKKLGRLIRSLLPKSSDPLNFNMLLDSDGTPFRSDAKTDKAAAAIMKDWMGVPDSLHPIASSLEADQHLWHKLLDGTMPLSQDLPGDIQTKIIAACRKRQISDAISAELHTAMHAPFTYAEFNHCRKALTPGKSPGPS